MHDIELVCPKTLGRLSTKREGLLVSEHTGISYPIINSIPRFSEQLNYSQNFGFQWGIFNKTQLDSYNGTGLSEARFYASTGWSPSDLTGSTILEVGSGAGRFTEVILRTTNASIWSVDYSTSVDTNLENNRQYLSRLSLVQASVYELPFKSNSFDYVFCLGVLQHTPNIFLTIKSIVEKTKPNGKIVVDFYPYKGFWTRIHSKYLVRPLTRNMPHDRLLNLIRKNIKWLMFCFDFLCKMRLGVLTRFLPITDLRGFPKLSKDKRIEWAILDTFDAFSPQFDSPLKMSTIVQIFTSLGCEISFSGIVTYSGGNSAIVRAVKK